MSRTRLTADAERRLRGAAGNRCGYCLSPQRLVFAPLEIEYIQPRSQGGSDDEFNLWLSCPLCNSYKSDKTSAIDPVTKTAQPLFNPRTQRWSEHFCWSDDGIHRQIDGRIRGTAIDSGNLRIMSNLRLRRA